MLYMFRTVLLQHQEQLLISFVSHLVYAGIAPQQPHVPAYTKCDVQLTKVAPDDGLIQSETCRASNGK